LNTFHLPHTLHTLGRFPRCPHTHGYVTAFVGALWTVTRLRGYGCYHLVYYTGYGYTLDVYVVGGLRYVYLVRLLPACPVVTRLVTTVTVDCHIYVVTHTRYGRLFNHSLRLVVLRYVVTHTFTVVVTVADVC